MHCKDCKWWQVQEYSVMCGQCDSPKAQWQDWLIPLPDGCTFDTSLLTGPEFGCVNFKAKE